MGHRRMPKFIWKTNRRFFEIISKLFLELLQKLDSDVVSMETIPMLIGIYEGLSVPKKEILKEIEKTGVNILNLELTLE